MSCTICFERFQGSDNNLYSTTCGHIFHFICMQQWKSRSNRCPQCRSNNPKTHKIYLELNEEEQNNTFLESKLSESRAKIARLELQLKNNLAMSGYGKNRRFLEETLESTLKHNSNLEKQLQEAETNINNLKMRLQTLTTDFNKIIVDKKSLEENYKTLQAEYHRVKENPNTYITDIITNAIRSSSITITGAKINRGSNLTNFVLYLGHKMGLHYVRNDIIRTLLLRGEQALYVQFREEQHRWDFYVSKHKLIHYPETENIEFFELDDDIFCSGSLFDYALNLKMFNYKSVFRQNDKVMVRQSDGDDAIVIYSKHHIEDLVYNELESDSEFEEESESDSEFVSEYEYEANTDDGF